jgi:hypothetical protein
MTTDGVIDVADWFVAHADLAKSDKRHRQGHTLTLRNRGWTIYQIVQGPRTGVRTGS